MPRWEQVLSGMLGLSSAPRGPPLWGSGNLGSSCHAPLGGHAPRASERLPLLAPAGCSQVQQQPHGRLPAEAQGSGVGMLPWALHPLSSDCLKAPVVSPAA